MHKFIRPGAYGLVIYQDKIVLIKKSRGPFTGSYDLPGGGIEHGEDTVFALYREIQEEIGVDDIYDHKLLGVYNHVVQHERNGEEYNTHLLGIVYVCKINSVPQMDKVSLEDNDSSDWIMIDISDYDKYLLTPICRYAIEDYVKTTQKDL